MLENLIKLVKENAGAIMNSPDIPADRKEEAVQTAGASIAGGFQEVLANGGVKDVLNLFSGKAANTDTNPVVQHISGNFIENMSEKFGINSQQAGSIASSLIPTVITQLINKTNDPADKSFDLQEMFNEFSGGKTSGFNVSSMLSKFKAGLDRDADGDVDLQDLKAMFIGTGGLVDKIKGIFK